MEHRTERKMVLTALDVMAVVDEIERRGIVHKCRYDVDPEDMESIVTFVKGVQNNVKEYQGGLRKAAIKIAVYLTIAGALNFIAEKMGLPSLKSLVNFLMK